MISLNLEKPVKISIVSPKGLEPDYETIGKLIDNIIVMANNQKLDLTKVGKEFSCEFVVGKKSKYSAKFCVTKTLYTLTVTYMKELTHYEATRAFAVPPKEKMLMKEAEKLAKEQVKKEKEKKEKGKSKKGEKKHDLSDLD